MKSLRESQSGFKRRKQDRNTTIFWTLVVVAVFLLLYSLISKIEVVEAQSKVIPGYAPIKEKPVKEYREPSIKVEKVPQMDPETEVEYANIQSFVEGYRGGRIDEQYLRLLYEGCDGDLYTLRLVIAIGVAESGLGRDVKADSNFWGWFKGGDRKYDPSREVMAEEICEGISEKYPNVHDDGDSALTYTGGDQTSTWLGNVNWALDQIDNINKGGK